MSLTEREVRAIVAEEFRFPVPKCEEAEKGGQNIFC